MGGAEMVVTAFRTLGKAGQTVFLPEGADQVASFSEDFVRITLVSDIPDQNVVRRIEGIMQGDGQFDDTEPGAFDPPLRAEKIHRFGPGLIQGCVAALAPASIYKSPSA